MLLNLFILKCNNKWKLLVSINSSPFFYSITVLTTYFTMCSWINFIKSSVRSLSLCSDGKKKTSLSPSHQSLWHFVLPMDQVKGCRFSSAKDFNSFQVSMRKENKSANPAFIQGSRFVSLLLDLHHPDWGPQRNSSWQLYQRKPSCVHKTVPGGCNQN